LIKICRRICIRTCSSRLLGFRSLMRKSGFLLNGPKANTSRPNIGFRLCRRIRRSLRSSSTLNCAGGSSAIRSSIKNSGSIITRDEGGAAFTTACRFASQPMNSWCPSRVSFPPQASKPRCSKRLPYPKVINPEDPPVIPERRSRRRSPASALGWRAPWRGDCFDALVANGAFSE
jgi:hypothetical protein